MKSPVPYKLQMEKFFVLRKFNKAAAWLWLLHLEVCWYSFPGAVRLLMQQCVTVSAQP